MTPSSVLPANVAVNEIEVNVPISWTVPLESLIPSGPSVFVGSPVIVLPDTVNPACPEIRLITVPAGKSRCDPSDPISSSGSLTGAPKLSV